MSEGRQRLALVKLAYAIRHDDRMFPVLQDGVLAGDAGAIQQIVFVSFSQGVVVDDYTVYVIAVDGEV